MRSTVKIIDGHITCSRCKKEKIVSDFGKCKHTKCGYTGDCKECRRYQKSLNKERIREIANKWYEENKVRVREQRKSPENRKKAREYKAKNAEKYSKLRALYKNNEQNRIQRNKHRNKVNARKIFNYHLSQGRIFKPKTCQECHIEEKLHGHHEDYAKPLEVIWLCVKCHQRRHRKDE